MNGDFIRLEKDRHIRTLVLDMPERRNALDKPMLREIAQAVSDVAADAEARVLVVRGHGRAFCAGADVNSLFGDPNRPVQGIREDLKQVYASFLGLLDLSIPTIAAVNGAAVGAGVNIALACDIIIAGPRAKFGITFADIGLHPGGGCSWFLARRMGYPRAMATVLGAQTLDAEAALAAGLISERADDADARAAELAATCAHRDPDLARNMKKAMQIACVADLPTTLEFESWAQASSVGQPAFTEFRKSFNS
jgi:enoyl-CoA hydratase